MNVSKSTCKSDTELIVEDPFNCQEYKLLLDDQKNLMK